MIVYKIESTFWGTSYISDEDSQYILDQLRSNVGATVTITTLEMVDGEFKEVSTMQAKEVEQ